VRVTSYNQTEAMMRRFKTYALLIEFDPEKPFCLMVCPCPLIHGFTHSHDTTNDTTNDTAADKARLGSGRGDSTGQSLVEAGRPNPLLPALAAHLVPLTARHRRHV
jgi:hypothetical protein